MTTNTDVYPECGFCHFRAWDDASLSRHLAVKHAIVTEVPDPV